MDQVREKNKGKKFDEDIDHSSESSDEYVKGIHFHDSKEETMNGFDEGFRFDPNVGDHSKMSNVD